MRGHGEPAHPRMRRLVGPLHQASGRDSRLGARRDRHRTPGASPVRPRLPVPLVGRDGPRRRRTPARRQRPLPAHQHPHRRTRAAGRCAGPRSPPAPQDATIDRHARGLAALRTPVFLSFDQEPEPDVGTEGTAADFVAAWRHIHDRFTAAGARNVIWVWTVTGYAGHRDLDRRALPGRPIRRLGQLGRLRLRRLPPQPSAELRRHRRPVLPAGSSTHGYGTKPFMLSEFGSTDRAGSRAWFAGIPDALPRFPNIRALILFNCEFPGPPRRPGAHPGRPVRHPGHRQPGHPRRLRRRRPRPLPQPPAAAVAVSRAGPPRRRPAARCRCGPGRLRHIALPGPAQRQPRHRPPRPPPRPARPSSRARSTRPPSRPRPRPPPGPLSSLSTPTTAGPAATPACTTPTAAPDPWSPPRCTRRCATRRPAALGGSGPGSRPPT